MAETFQLEQAILSERETPDSPVGDVGSAMSDKELMKKIISYLRQIADGDVDQAQKIVDSITTCGVRAVNILDQIAVNDMPEPELADIPQQILAGLIRDLRTKIG